MTTTKSKALLYPRRKGADLDAFDISSRKPVVLDADSVKQLFHLPLRDAADRVGICVTSLKRVCRRLGIGRWPYTKPLVSSQDVTSETPPNTGGMKYADCLVSSPNRSEATGESSDLHSFSVSDKADSSSTSSKNIIVRSHPQTVYTSLLSGMEPGNDIPVICGDFVINDEFKPENDKAVICGDFVIDDQFVGQCGTTEFPVQGHERDSECDDFKLFSTAADSSCHDIPVLPSIQSSCAVDVSFEPPFASFTGDNKFLTWYLQDGAIDFL